MTRTPAVGRPGRSAPRSLLLRSAGSGRRGSAAPPRSRACSRCRRAAAPPGRRRTSRTSTAVCLARQASAIDVLAGDVPARRPRACRCGRPRPAGASRPACAAPPGWRSAACRRSRARGSTPRSARGSGRRCRRRGPRARSARRRTARRSGRSRSSPRRPGCAAGTRTSTNDSSAVSEQCQPILVSARSTVKPGVPFSTTSRRDRRRGPGRRCGPRWSRSRRARRW